MSWLSDVLTSTQEFEAPERFFYWSALAALSAVVRKNVRLNKFQYWLYPNIFVILVAKSGGRKGKPVSLARSMVEQLHCTKIIYGRSSIQFAIRELGKTKSSDNGLELKEAHGFLISGELASFLVKDPDSLTILTDLYDTHAYESGWRNSIKGSSGTGAVDILKSPCLTLLGATNEDLFSIAIPPNNVGGGFIGRSLVVFEEGKKCRNALMRAPVSPFEPEKLGARLEQIKNLKGEMKYTEEAGFIYEHWYNGFEPEKQDDPTGTLERIHDTIQKVAMLLSLAEQDDLIIEKRHIEESLEVCLQCVAGMKRVTLGAGRNEEVTGTVKMVLQELLMRPDHKVERAKLIAKFWIDVFTLDRAMETLDASNAIKIEKFGRSTVYTLKQEIVDRYLGYKKEIN